MEDKAAESFIKEFVRLETKIYPFLVGNSNEQKKIKGCH